jgi:lipopolysaccharide export system permease protein
MSNNSELTAIKAGGISVYRLVYPVMGFALFASFLCLAFSEIVIPRSNKMAEKIRKENILKIKDHFVRENIFTKTGPKSLMCAQQIDLSKKTMKNIMFIHLGDDNKPKHRIVAKSAIYKKETWLFYDVTLFKFEKGGVSRFVKQYPQKKLFFHEKPEQFEEESKKPKHMSMKALRKKIYEIKQTGSESPVNFQVEYYLKTAVPFSTFIFAIIGVAMGFKPGRSGAFVGFGISLLVIFAYYVAMSFSRSYGRLGFLPPPIAGWMQNFLFLGIGLWLLSKVEH